MRIQSVSHSTCSSTSRRRPVLANPATAPAIVGIQNQRLIPMITSANAPGCQGSSYLVEMPAGHLADMHLHEDTEVQVMSLDNWAATISCEPDGSDITVTVQGYHEICYVPRGRAHTAVNLSTLVGVTAVEFRPGDPDCNHDVIELPGLQHLAKGLAIDLQRQHSERLIASALSGAAPW